MLVDCFRIIIIGEYLGIQNNGLKLIKVQTQLFVCIHVCNSTCKLTSFVNYSSSLRSPVKQKKNKKEALRQINSSDTFL